MRWMTAWIGGPLIGIANGSARELTYGRRTTELTAHQVSTGAALVLFTAYFAALERRWPLPSKRAALEVGAGWAALTVGFEFGFGRGIAHQPWSKLLGDYDLRRGRVWGLVPVWMALGPLTVRAASRRDASGVPHRRVGRHPWRALLQILVVPRAARQAAGDGLAAEAVSSIPCPDGGRRARAGARGG